MKQHRTGIIIGLVVAVLVIGGGLYWFQPWKLWVDTRVDEALPATASTSLTTPVVTRSPLLTPRSSTSAQTSATPVPSTGAVPDRTGTPPSEPVPTEPVPVEPEPVGPVVLLAGNLISHEHETSGSVAVVQLPDGSRVLTLENLSTSDGPDVRVWLSSAPMLPGEAGWYTFADAPHVDLGALKGNLGNQVYEIPADVDLAALPNVSLWCQRFSVSFGAAELAA